MRHKSDSFVLRMLCRDMKELRELVCQSRLDYHGSDYSDVDSDDFSDSLAMGDAGQNPQSHRLGSADFSYTETPDSGLASSLQQCCSISDFMDGAAVNSATYSVAGHVKKSAARTLENISRTTENFARILNRVNHRLIARWLQDANAVIAQLSDWCRCGDNFIAFGHFWLSEFPSVERNSLIQMEHGIFVDRLASVFPPASNLRLCDVTTLAEAILHEYPRRLLSVEGPRLILHWLDVLTSPKRCEQFRKTFASIHCSTTCHQHSEIVLSLRAFALVSLVSAFVDFYQKLVDNDVHRPTDDDEPIPSAREEYSAASEQLSVSEQRMCTSVRPVFYYASLTQKQVQVRVQARVST